MKKMMRQQQGAMMDMMYGGLFKELGLTQEETDKFKELLLDRQMKAVETGGAFMKLQSEDNDRTAAMSELAEQQKEFDEQVKAFLGDARYTQYKDYNETMTERMTLNQFSEQMAGGRNPLNADQTSQLLEIMKQERKGMTPMFSETTVDGSATNRSRSTPKVAVRHLPAKAGSSAEARTWFGVATQMASARASSRCARPR